MWTGLAQDLRYTTRLFGRQPAFVAIAVLTMALGIGATTTLFSVTYGVLMKPLPWPDADRLVRLTESRAGRDPRVRGTITNATYVSWYDQPTTIEALGGWRVVPATAVIGSGEPSRIQTAAVSPSLFTVLKARPLLGRLFVDDDGKPGANYPSRDVIILSYGLWQDAFGGSERAVGRVVQVDEKPLTIVGVMPRDFAFPDRETRAWTPWAVPALLHNQNGRPLLTMVIFPAIARLRAGVTPAQAAAEVTARSRSAPDPGMTAVALFGAGGPADVAAVPAIQMMTAEVRPALLVLLAAVALLFVTATANVASLQLARAATRRREMAIRAAIGAGTARLARQLVVESVAIGAAGGVAGLTLAIVLHRVLPSVLPADFPRAADVTMNGWVVAFAIAAALVAGVACGLLPAAHARRVNLVESLADDGSAPVGAGMRSPTARARSIIVAGQLAVSCVLLVGASLLARSFIALLHADRGYDPTNVLTARIPIPAGYSMQRRIDLLESVVARLRAGTGVRDAAFGNALPLLSAGGYRGFKWRAPANPSVEVEVNTIQRGVSPGYFSALGIRLVAGRVLNSGDTMAAPQVVVVNRSFAAKYLGERPLDAVVPSLGMCRGDNDRWQVVGVVEDVRQGSAADPPQPELFIPASQIGCPTAMAQPVIVVRTTGDPAAYVSTLRALVRAEAPALPLDSVMTMDQRVMTTLAKPRLYAVVLVGFGAFALVIAGVGMFGVLSYSVAQRAREIGVRTALGARQIDIVALVLGQTARMAVAGIAAGVCAAFVAARMLTTVLYGVNPHDAATFIAVPVLLAVVAAIACGVPASRAARADPLTVLK